MRPVSLIGLVHVATENQAEKAIVGHDIGNVASPLDEPTPVRGRAGGLARARQAWRYSDGTFMSDSEKEAVIEESELDEYERFAAGGRARAARAKRASDGTFLPKTQTDSAEPKES